MFCNFPTIKITEGNAFTLIFPLKRRSYVAEKPIDEDIDITRLNDVHVTLGGVEYAPTIEMYGVRIDVPATLARGTYDGLLTADYDGNAIRGAYESCVQIVAWNAQSNAQQYILGSPVATKAAYVLGYMPTYEEVEALKQQLREQIAAAEQAEAEAIAEKQRYADAIDHLDDIAKQGDDPEVSLTSLYDIIERLDISKVAQQGTDRTATNTAIRDKVDEIIATIGGEADINAVYLGLLNRQTDYQAEGFPDKQDLPHLPQAVAAFTPRKISNGGAENDGIPDGISLAQLFCSTSAISSVTEIVDTNVGWTWTNTFTQFPKAKRITLNAAGDKVYGFPLIKHEGVEELIVPYLNRVEEGNSQQGSFFFQCPNLKVFRLDRLTFWQGGYEPTEMPLLRELYMPNCQSYLQSITYGGFKAKELEKWVLGKLNSFKMANNYGTSFMASCHNLIHIEVGEGTACSLPMAVWNPTTALSERLPEFLSNFQEYIADRVEDRTGKTAITITLSAAVYEALQAQEGQTILATLTNKNWTVASA